MSEQNFTASQMFRNANRFIEAYHAALQPVCRDTGLPPMAVDILMFFANNPESGTAKDVCQCRGFKSGIVSVHVDRAGRSPATAGKRGSCARTRRRRS